MAFPGKLDLEAYFGSQLSISIQYKDSGGTGINVASKDITLVVRDSKEDPRKSLTLTESSGISVTDASTGQFTVTFSASQVSTLGSRGKNVGSVYELVTTEGSVVEIIMAGRFTVFGG